ncbi:DUF523 domain-containing protein [Clostridium sp. MSJ-8]|uniref:DUF523 domain-containing protein n=1 Tax=Clostridium sp. MSJ-8 TaxID=2841510 RepID=UPI001C0F36D0|nr:DUF523 domain-containing protein [Clostridium sp. MSJ-8]MBU5487584.1 DUF523 domain-containing protein [Clostridium sp. MSJ-8]
MIMISSCLCGVNCKYNGKNNKNDKCVELLRENKAICFCPEQLGGLTTPRVPSEIREDRVVSKEGIDVTDNFKRGAKEALKIAQITGIKKAIMKEGSPSCGVHYIYDGTFSGNKIEGMGITTRMFLENNIEVVSEEQIL